MSMGFAGMFVAFFLFVLVGGGLVTALILLIVGAIKKIKVMWITGAVVLALTLAAIAGAVVLGILGYRSTQTSFQTMVVQSTAVPYGIDAISFETCTGVPLPPNASVNWTNSVFGRDTTFEIMVLTVPAADQPVLLANFTQATWATVKPNFGSPSDYELPHADWPPAYAGAPCYNHTYTDRTGDRYQSWLVCEPGTETIYVRVKLPPGEPLAPTFLEPAEPSDGSD